MRIHVAIAAGLIAGLAFGLLASITGVPLIMSVAVGVAPIGTAFVNLLKMVVIPLITATLFVGVAGLGNVRQLGKLGAMTLGFFALTTAMSILIGMGVMRALLPLASEAAAQAAATASAEVATLPSLIDFLLGLIPANPFAAAAEGQLLQLIVFTCFMGAAVGSLRAEHRDRLMALGQAVVEALIKLVHWILWAAPVGVFALAAPVTARSGWAMLQSLAVFIIAVLVGLFTFVAVVYLPIIRYFTRVSLRDFLRECLEPQLIAFATTSQATAVPAMLESTDRLGLSRTSSSLVIGLGAAIGRAGSALFQGASVVFLAWLYSVPIPLEALGLAVLVTAMVSITVAGVPSGSVVTLAPALDAVGVPLDGMAVLLGVDRIPDMFRTATNVTGTMTAAAVMDTMTDGGTLASDTPP